MKKRTILSLAFIFLFLTIILISSTSNFKYNNQINNNNYNKKYYRDNTDSTNNKDNLRKNIIISSSRTFLITYPNGRSHYRTFHGLNKRYSKSNKGFFNEKNRIGIYLNLFDSNHNPKTITKNYLERSTYKKSPNCPIGWTCSK